jgi:hypothetical protein
MQNDFGAAGTSTIDGTNTGTYANQSGHPVYLYVAKFTSSGETLWVLSAANYDAISPGGITEAELNATNTATATNAITTGGISTSQYLQLCNWANWGDNADLHIDELKYGETVGDVTSAIPEPATMALLSLGAVAMLFGRRRTRKS